MNRITLIALQLSEAGACILVWHLLTTIPVGGKPLFPPFFFSTPLDVAARIVKWFSEGTIGGICGLRLSKRCSLSSSARSPAS